MAVGRVIRFDGMRGYGFIAPERGGEDVFLHVNDLLIPEASVRSGLAVEFEVEEGERGLKASGVRLAPDAVSVPTRMASSGRAPVAPVVDDSGLDGLETMCDVLSLSEYTGEVTELLLAAVPELTGRQIVAVRERFVQFGKRHGWVED